ncbi:MAG TPA: hypothetical protein VI544_01995 [Candidatus Nanoarchaeia archaeon]|nr:hypothetical protein [Candidatus Nanoarchaeia archaeon]
MKEVVNLWRNIFLNWKYFFLTAGVAVSFYGLNAIVANFGNISYFYFNIGFLGTLLYIFDSIIQLKGSILFSSFITLSLLSILTGFFASLLFYNFNLVKNTNIKMGFFGSLGLFLGILAPGCVSCGMGLVVLLGFGASLAALPFQGREISFLGIGILLFSIIKTSINIATPKSCQLDTAIHKNEN